MVSDEPRNPGITIALMVFFACLYVLAAEYVKMLPPRSDVLLFQRGEVPIKSRTDDEEALLRLTISDTKPEDPDIATNTDMLGTSGCESSLEWSYLRNQNWKERIADLKPYRWLGQARNTYRAHDSCWYHFIRRISSQCQGASGAGKTSLLNVLAERTALGIISGTKFLDSRYQNIAFARKIGYAQQDDIHLDTASVHEALTFSALLRQPEYYSKKERLAHVNHVIELLDMEPLQHAVLGRLNVEQRKRVTIAIELAARPELLLFLDEPTSGLDSDSAWYFCTLLRRLADSGQAILCTIHQPSSPLLTLFDRLLFLKEGHSMYFGDFGPDFRTVIGYFEKHEARECKPHENPAEWMMEVTSNDALRNELDWADIWNNSDECAAVRNECEQMRQQLSARTTVQEPAESRPTEFATSFGYQLLVVTKRAFQRDWRSPEYLYSKSLTISGCVSTQATFHNVYALIKYMFQAFINGVIFWASGNTSQDIQNQILSHFMLTTMFGTHVQLIMARFYESRVLYENRERQLRTYS